MSDDQRQIEREWIEAADERDRLRAASLEARRKGGPDAVAEAKARLKRANERCRAIMEALQASINAENRAAAKPAAEPKPPLRPTAVPAAAPPAAVPVKPATPTETAHEIIATLEALMSKAESSKLPMLANLLALVRDEAKRETERLH